MEGPSNQNPEKLFHFTISKSANPPKFKLAFDVLIDRHFNPTGLGVIEVNEDRVDFIAQNVDTNALGNLTLNSTALEDFYFNSRCQDKLITVNFRDIFDIFTDADNINEDSITFSHLHGSDNITINLGNDPLKEYNVRMLARVPGLLERFPTIQCICAAVSSSNELRSIVDRLEFQGNNELVSVDVHIQQTTVSVFRGDVLLLRWEYEDGLEGTISVAPEVNHRGRFIWPHLDVLRKASLLESLFELCYTQPDELIMTHFVLEELGDLRFIMIPPDSAAPAPAPADAPVL